MGMSFDSFVWETLSDKKTEDKATVVDFVKRYMLGEMLGVQTDSIDQPVNNRDDDDKYEPIEQHPTDSVWNAYATVFEVPVITRDDRLLGGPKEREITWYAGPTAAAAIKRETRHNEELELVILPDFMFTYGKLGGKGETIVPMIGVFDLGNRSSKPSFKRRLMAVNAAQLEEIKASFKQHTWTVGFDYRNEEDFKQVGFVIEEKNTWETEMGRFRMSPSASASPVIEEIAEAYSQYMAAKELFYRAFSLIFGEVEVFRSFDDFCFREPTSARGFHLEDEKVLRNKPNNMLVSLFEALFGPVCPNFDKVERFIASKDKSSNRFRDRFRETVTTSADWFLNAPSSQTNDALVAYELSVKQASDALMIWQAVLESSFVKLSMPNRKRTNAEVEHFIDKLGDLKKTLGIDDLISALNAGVRVGDILETIDAEIEH